MAASFNASKRTLRNIWPHLVVSACALLLPPLGMAAGVVYLGSSHPHETVASRPAEQAAPIVLAAAPTRAPDPGPAVASAPVTSPTVANAVPSPAEQRPAPEPQVAAAPAPAAAAAARASTKDTGPKDTATKDVAAKDVAAKDAAPVPAAAPAAVGKIDETSEPTARAEATATETAETPAAPAANAQQSGQKSRHESHGGRVRQARIPSITDIFLHPVRAR
jgi:hypothetical protein